MSLEVQPSARKTLSRRERDVITYRRKRLISDQNQMHEFLDVEPTTVTYKEVFRRRPRKQRVPKEPKEQKEPARPKANKEKKLPKPASYFRSKWAESKQRARTRTAIETGLLRTGLVSAIYALRIIKDMVSKPAAISVNLAERIVEMCDAAAPSACDTLIVSRERVRGRPTVLSQKNVDAINKACAYVATEYQARFLAGDDTSARENADGSGENSDDKETSWLDEF